MMNRRVRTVWCCLATVTAAILGGSSAESQQAWYGAATVDPNANFLGGGDRNPSIATDGTIWMAVWQRSEHALYVSRSLNGGLKWQNSVEILPDLVAGSTFDMSPTISSVGAGDWVVTFMNNRNTLSACSQDVFFVRSADNGLTWSAPARINTINDCPTDGMDLDPDSASAGNGGNGTVVTVWESSDDGVDPITGSDWGNDDDIFVSVSTDHGASWSAQAPLGPFMSLDEDCDVFLDDGVSSDDSPSVATAGGHWVAVWRSTAHLYRIEAGDTEEWLTCQEVLDADMSGDELTMLPETESDIDIFFATTTDPFDWNPARPVDVAGGDDGLIEGSPSVAIDQSGFFIIVWKRGDSIVMCKGGEHTQPIASPVGDVLSVSAPTVTAGPDGRWFVTWRANEGGQSNIYFIESSDGGVFFSNPQILNPNGVFRTESTSNLEADVAVSGSGYWLAAWASDWTMDGALGGGFNVLAARSFENIGLEAALFSQPVTDPTSLQYNTDESSTFWNVEKHESFTGFARPIETVAWYGTEWDPDALVAEPLYQITFYDYAAFLGGFTGDELVQFDVAAERTSTGVLDRFGDLVYRYEAALPEPLSLAAGAVSIVSVIADFEDSYSSWARSNTGDSQSYEIDHIFMTSDLDSWDMSLELRALPAPVIELPVDGSISSNISPHLVQEGDLLTLSAPAGSNYQWQWNGADLNDTARIFGAQSRILNLAPVLQTDSGTYTVTYDNGTKAVVQTEPFVLNVLPPNSVPAGSFWIYVALSFAVVGLSLAQVRRIRR